MASKSVLDLTGAYQTAEEIETGQWVPLDSGLEVWVARANSPEFFRCAAAANKKFSKGRGDKREVPPDKVIESTVWVMARATFKGFRGPNNEKTVSINDEVFEDTVAGRMGLLTVWPDFREELATLAGMSADEFAEEIAEAGKD